MARKPREEVAGGIYHVYARGNDRRLLFLDDEDRDRYFAGLGLVVAKHEWRCLAYCLMDNHVHLLMETPVPNLGRGMQRLHSGFARGFHKRHGTSGHLFQGRYGAVRATSDGQLHSAAAYIACNPCDAGACPRPEDWPWSSHAVLAGHVDAPPWLDGQRLLAYFGARGGEPLERYRDHVAERWTGVQARARAG
jgi:putative transposase